jgi:hypothetical protein
MASHEDGVPLPFDHPDLGDTFYAILDTLVRESDRGAVLIGASLVDSFLRQLFEKIAPEGMSKKTLRSILEYPGALSSLSAKADIALSTRLIGTHLHRSIHLLRRIRNDVAHSPNSFLLAEHRDHLWKMYELGPGIPAWINQTAAHLLFTSFISNLKESGVADQLFESPKDVLIHLADFPDVLNTLQEKALRFELALAVSMICTSLILVWERVQISFPGNQLLGVHPPASAT